MTLRLASSPSTAKLEAMADTVSLADIVRLIEQDIPFNRLLGLEVEEFTGDTVKVGFDGRDDLIGNYALRVLHGGVISAALDLVGGLTALAAILEEMDDQTPEALAERFARFGTIDLRVDYLRPGSGTRFTASGVPLRVGRRVAVTRMELTNEQDTLIAVGTGTYITG